MPTHIAYIANVGDVLVGARFELDVYAVTPVVGGDDTVQHETTGDTLLHAELTVTIHDDDTVGGGRDARAIAEAEELIQQAGYVLAEGWDYETSAMSAHLAVALADPASPGSPVRADR